MQVIIKIEFLIPLEDISTEKMFSVIAVIV